MNTISHRKIVVKRFGGPESLTLVETQTLPPPKGYARVKVLAIGVGYADIMARRGEYLLDHKRPLTPGYELVGEVYDFSADSLDSKPAWLKVGCRIAVCLPKMGAYTEYICLPYDLLIPIPEGVDLYQAAALPLNYLTAVSLLDRHGQVAQGDRILIHGASGGVGEAVCQLGHRRGLKIYGTASLQHANRLDVYGVRVIDYRQQDFEEVIQREEPHGLKAVFDSIGGSYISKSYRLLCAEGILVSYAFAGRPGRIYWDTLSGALRVILAGRLSGSKRTAICSVPREIKQDNTWYRTGLARLLDLLAVGELTSTIREVFPLQEAAAAHRLLEERSKPGKVLLQVA